MPQTQRMRVYKGELKKTSGGLTKKDLVRNKRGKIVSRKKSTQSRDQNNLGDFLRALGEKVKKEEMLRPSKKPVAQKPVAKPKAVAAKPKKVLPKPKVAPPAKAPQKPAAPKKKKRLPKGYNPITRQPREEKSGLGFVKSGKVNLDNVTTLEKPLKRRRRGRGYGFTVSDDILEARRRREAEKAQ